MTGVSTFARLPVLRLCGIRGFTASRARQLLPATPAPGRRRPTCSMAASAAPAQPAAPAQFSAALTAIDEGKYDEQLQAKVERVKKLFAEFQPPELEAYRSPPKNYRMRSEFRVWHDKDEVYYIMFEKDEKGEQRQVRVDQFPVASELLNGLMAAVMREVRRSDTLRGKLYQVNFHTTLSGQSMVTLIYHRKLNKAWEGEARLLQNALAAVPGATATPSIIGRSRGQKLVVGKDEVQETLEVDGQQLKYIQVEASFSQPNARMCCHMLSWARSVTEGSQGHDLLELYCGNANFTIALAPNFRKVVATEVSKSGVAAAKRNLELNGVGNVFVARMSSEEFTEAWQGGRHMNRLSGLDVDALELKTLLVDPPRAGLDDQTVQLLADFDNVVYISCNPETLHKNLTEVAELFDIKRFALFDQFPYTHHIECGVYLQRKPKADAAPAAGAAATDTAGAAANGVAEAEGDEREGGSVAAEAAQEEQPGSSGEREGVAADAGAAGGEGGSEEGGRGVKRKAEGEAS